MGLLPTSAAMTMSLIGFRSIGLTLCLLGRFERRVQGPIRGMDLLEEGKLVEHRPLGRNRPVYHELMAEPQQCHSPSGRIAPSTRTVVCGVDAPSGGHHRPARSVVAHHVFDGNR